MGYFSDVRFLGVFFFPTALELKVSKSKHVTMNEISEVPSYHLVVTKIKENGAQSFSLFCIFKNNYS